MGYSPYCHKGSDTTEHELIETGILTAVLFGPNNYSE